MFLLSNNSNKLNRILKTTTCIQKLTIHNTVYLLDTKNTDKTSNTNTNESKTTDSKKNLKAKYAKMSFISLNDTQKTFSSSSPKVSKIPESQTQPQKKEAEKQRVEQNAETPAKTQPVYTPSISLQFKASISKATETAKETKMRDIKIENHFKEKQEKKLQVNFENQLESKANELAKLVNRNKEEQRKTTDEILGPVLNPKLLDQFKKKTLNRANSTQLNEPTIEKLNHNDKEYRNFLKKTENLSLISKDETMIRKEKVNKRKVPFWAGSPYQKFQNLSGGNGLALFGSDFKPVVTTTLESPIWSMHHDEQLKLAQQSLPINGFDELIQLTNEGKIWKFPIDNEQGVDESDAGVPFHEHIFLDHYLDEFPQIEPIQQFMTLVLNGISQNSFLTIQEKKDIINWYKTYFHERLDIINEALEAERLEASYRELSAKK